MQTRCAADGRSRQICAVLRGREANAFVCTVLRYHNGVHVSTSDIPAHWLLCMPCARPCAANALKLQKLFQAVEEARGLLAEAAAAASRSQRGKQLCATASNTSQRPRRRQRKQPPQTPEQQKQKQKREVSAQPQPPVQVPAYPPPVRDDMGRNAKQLLKWLKAAAADPEVCSTYILV
jgi:hypothetical protein